jgi:hypothetical protein
MINKISKLIHNYSILFSFGLGVIVFLLLSEFKLDNAEDLNSLLTNLIQFSGIFSAIIITLIISKIFQIRQEKVDLIGKVEELCNKVTDVRRIALILINTYEFWNPNMRKYMDRNFKVLNKCLMNEIGINSNHKYFELKQNLQYELGQTGTANSDEYNSQFYGFEFYFDMKALVVGDENNIELMYSLEDKNLIYPIEQIAEFKINHCGDFWYFFSKNNKGGIHSSNFNLNALTTTDRNKILILAQKIDIRFSNKQLDKELLADIGSLFTTQIVPELLRYLKIFESDIPEIIRTLIQLLFVILLAGLLLPLSLTAVIFKVFLFKLYLTNFCLSFIFGSVFYFLINIVPILKSTIRMDELVYYSYKE